LTGPAVPRLLEPIFAPSAPPPPDPRDDVAALVRRATSGDRAAVDQLVRRVLCPLLEARIARQLARHGGNRQELADRVQQVLLRLFENDAAALRRWDPARGSLSAYVGTIADHTLISEARRPAQPAPTEAPDDARSPDSGPESKVAFRSVLRAIVDELGEEDFTLFRLVYMEGLSPDEVATLLELRKEAVYKRIQRLRPRVRELCERLVSNPEQGLRTLEQDRP
jgi:RNA polymerase sigma factor (sigma-70 family)